MRSIRPLSPTQTLPGLAAILVLILFNLQTCPAYTHYDGCLTCHGDFRGPTSTKGTVFPSNNNHEMHRASTSMGTACNLCHIGSSRTPVIIGASTGTANNPGLGCVGCHVSAGLREHHQASGVTECYDCHTPETPPAENVKPPYYGTADTKVKNPGNPAQVANTNENWSVGDFLGLDNDGNDLYDLADYAVGPYQITSVVPEGNNLRVTWLTAGGRTNQVQAANSVNGTYTNASLNVRIPGVGLVTTNYLDLGGATNPTRFYRLKSVVRAAP
ncbi:MAG: hypothetical protein QM813_03820 [Verrucomicrobiota bacterium]